MTTCNPRHIRLRTAAALLIVICAGAGGCTVRGGGEGASSSTIPSVTSTASWPRTSAPPDSPATAAKTAGSATTESATTQSTTTDPITQTHGGVPPSPGPTASPLAGSGPGCVALAEALTQIHTDADLTEAKVELLAVLDLIDDGAGDEDQLIVDAAEWARNALSVDPSDPVLGGQWADTVARTLQPLFSRCVDAGYIERPS